MFLISDEPQEILLFSVGGKSTISCLIVFSLKVFPEMPAHDNVKLTAAPDKVVNVVDERIVQVPRLSHTDKHVYARVDKIVEVFET